MGLTDLPISRRIELRQTAVSARLRRSLVVLTPYELDEMLDAYEHGRFSTRDGHSVHCPARQGGKCLCEEVEASG